MKKSSNSIKQGQIYRLGDHVMACGDCRDKDLIARLVGKLKIKAVIIDPPYGVAVAESKEGFQALSKNKPIANDHLQSDLEYKIFTRDWIKTIIPYMANKNAFYIFNSDKMIFALREGMLEVGLKFAQLLIWVKNHSVIGRMDYAPQHELIAYGWYGTHEFLRSKDKSVLVYPKPNKSPLHPSTKPIELIRNIILNSTRIGDVVFDGFLGSGTTLLGCQQTKRVCIGVEIDPEYVLTTIKQFETLTGIKAKLI
ncbi:MAG: site-specific DNA-methyltransferase [bacterium]